MRLENRKALEIKLAGKCWKLVKRAESLLHLRIMVDLLVDLMPQIRAESLLRLRIKVDLFVDLIPKIRAESLLHLQYYCIIVDVLVDVLVDVQIDVLV